MTASPFRRLRFQCLLLIASVVTTASAALLNVQILGRAANPEGKPDARPPAYSGPGAIGQEGDYWNTVPVDVYGKPFKIKYPTRLFASDGKTQTGITFRCRGFYSADHWPGTDGAPVTNRLMNSYLVCNVSASVLIDGLVPGAAYDLCFFGNNSRAGAGAGFAANDAETRSTGGAGGGLFTEGVDYVRFQSVPADKAGQIRITVSPGEARVGILNGFQLRGDLPGLSQAHDPSHWNLKLWLKADELARAGLKPGQPVTEWKDSAHGIPLRGDPTPPCSDAQPMYEEVTMPGRSKPVPAVRFDGKASVRQCESIGTADNPLTAFIVYWPEDDREGKWLQAVATRADALCLYDSGLAFETEAV